MSKIVFIYGLFYAFHCFGAVNPNGMSIPVPATPMATATATDTNSAVIPALVPAPTPAPVTAEIGFSEGSYALPPGGVQNIQIALREAGRRGRIAEVQVLAWGDGATTPGRAAAGAEVNLANQRGQAVAGFVRAGNPDTTVKNVNVAQNPSALQTLLADPSLAARSALGNVGVFNPDTAVTHPKAVVLVVVH